MRRGAGEPIHGSSARVHRGDQSRPAPGQVGLVMLGLTGGILLMAIQLWLLTLAFNLYLSGDRRGTLIAAAISGVIFLGGLMMLFILRRSAHRR